MKHFTRGALLKIFCRKNSQNSQKSIWMDGCVFSTVSGLHLAIFFKKGFHLRCFSLNIAKSIKTVVKLCVKNNQHIWCASAHFYARVDFKDFHFTGGFLARPFYQFFKIWDNCISFPGRFYNLFSILFPCSNLLLRILEEYQPCLLFFDICKNRMIKI